MRYFFNFIQNNWRNDLADKDKNDDLIEENSLSEEPRMKVNLSAFKNILKHNLDKKSIFDGTNNRMQTKNGFESFNKME